MPQPLGQHFLKNKAAITQIIDALQIEKGEVVIEIGPGAGALTVPLAERCAKAGARLIAIEKDHELAASLQLLAFSGKEHTEIVYGDVLQELPAIVSRYKLTDKSYKLVGNIPYYITGAILRTISELPHKPLVTVLMVQKEVAVRACAEQGKMNLLAAATQVWAQTQLLFTLPPKDFDPPPAVWSAVMRLTFKNQTVPEQELEQYYAAIKVLFKQPRKTLLNNLCEGGIPREEATTLLQRLSLDEKTRAQELTVEMIQKIAVMLPR